jgi:hypothetical protein
MLGDEPKAPPEMFRTSHRGLRILIQSALKDSLQVFSQTLREVFFSHPSKVPVEFKKEGDDWLAIYNPEIPRTLDVELMHTLTHDRCCFFISTKRLLER